MSSTYLFLISLLNRSLGPQGESHNAPKIPTLINYKLSKFTWGAAVNHYEDNIVSVKLLLDPNQEKPLHLPTSNVKNDLKKLPKTPVTVTADFIGALYQHALKEIFRAVPKSYLELCQKQFVLSGESLPALFVRPFVQYTHIVTSPCCLVRCSQEQHSSCTKLSKFLHIQSLRRPRSQVSSPSL